MTDLGQNREILHKIPCMFLQTISPTPKVLLNFHGNGEDVMGTRLMLEALKLNLHVKFPIFICKNPIISIAQHFGGRISGIWGVQRKSDG